MYSSVEVQLVYVVCVVVIVFSVTGIWMPWRAMVLNHYDVSSSIVLSFIGIFGIIFVSLDKEIQVGQQHDMDVSGKMDERTSFARVLSALIAIFLALFGALCMWCASMAIPSQMEKQATASLALRMSEFQRVWSVCFIYVHKTKVARRIASKMFHMLTSIVPLCGEARKGVQDVDRAAAQGDRGEHIQGRGHSCCWNPRVKTRLSGRSCAKALWLARVLGFVERRRDLLSFCGVRALDLGVDGVRSARSQELPRQGQRER